MDCRKPKIPETSQGQGHVRDNEAVVSVGID